MKFGDLTYQEIKRYADTGWLVIVPTGCTEQQGPHLPVDTDTWFVKSVCNAASEKAEILYSIHSLVLPALPFGPTPEHKGFGSGYIHLPQEVHEVVIMSILDSLAEQGFQRIILWKGCGQHKLSRTVDDFNKKHQSVSKTFCPELPYHDIWCKIGNQNIPGGHADSFITSLMMHQRPEAVRHDLITEPQNKPVNWEDIYLDLSQYSSTGVIGDPTKASRGLGAKLWAAGVDKIACIIHEYAQKPIT